MDIIHVIFTHMITLIALMTLITRITVCVRLYKWLFHSYWRMVISWLSYIHLLLAFVEAPSRLDFMGLSEHQASIALLALESVIISAYLLDCSLSITLIGPENLYSKHKALLARLAISLLFTIDRIGWEWNRPRFSRFLRPAMVLLRSRNVRRVYIGLLSSIPKLVETYQATMGVIAFFALIGFVIDSVNPSASDAFQSFPNAFWTLFLIYANTPHVTEVINDHLSVTTPPPTWVSVGLLPLFLYIFVIIVHMLLWRMVVAISAQTLKTQTIRHVVKFSVRRDKYYHKAFDLLCDTGYHDVSKHYRNGLSPQGASFDPEEEGAGLISLDKWVRFVLELRPGLSEDICYHIASLMHLQRGSCLSYGVFAELTDHMLKLQVPHPNKPSR